jgi:hypothetical protein
VDDAESALHLSLEKEGVGRIGEIVDQAHAPSAGKLRIQVVPGGAPGLDHHAVELIDLVGGERPYALDGDRTGLDANARHPSGAAPEWGGARGPA